MVNRIIEWKNDNEYEIMKYTYNYNVHNVVRYFRNQNGIVSKDILANI